MIRETVVFAYMTLLSSASLHHQFYLFPYKLQKHDNYQVPTSFGGAGWCVVVLLSCPAITCLNRVDNYFSYNIFMAVRNSHFIIFLHHFSSWHFIQLCLRINHWRKSIMCFLGSFCLFFFHSHLLSLHPLIPLIYRNLLNEFIYFFINNRGLCEISSSVKVIGCEDPPSILKEKGPILVGDPTHPPIKCA